ncbi:hypothetical protein N325_03265, partial [Colius striatus]
EEDPQAARVKVAGGQVQLLHLMARGAYDRCQDRALERSHLDRREVDSPEGADGLSCEALVLELVQEEEVVHQLRGGQPFAALSDNRLLHGLGDLKGCQVLDGAAQLLKDGTVTAGQDTPHEDGEELKHLIIRGFIRVAHGALYTQDAGIDLVQDIIIVVVFLFEQLFCHGVGNSILVLAA